jgi:hypothetical protein
MVEPLKASASPRAERLRAVAELQRRLGRRPGVRPASPCSSRPAACACPKRCAAIEPSIQRCMRSAFAPSHRPALAAAAHAQPVSAQCIHPRSRRPPQRHVFTQQRLHILDQGLHIGPDLQRRLQHLARQRVALLAPVILCSLGLTLAFIGLQRFIKQIAAVERMLAQHALAPGVYGVDGGIVHALRSHVQPPGSCVALLPSA